MTDGFYPADLLGVMPRPPAQGNAEASTPLAAAFILGCGVPEHARQAVIQLVVGTTPHHGYGDDGSQTWEWDAPGMYVHLTLHADGGSEGTWRVASEQPEFVDGEIVRTKEIN